MKKFILILGGARSGKSSYAVESAKRLKGRVAFIATAGPFDREMRERIKLHKLSRPRDWKVIEEGKDICPILSKLKGECKIVLIDCIGFLISNLLADNLKDKGIENRIRKIIGSILKSAFTTIVVSNEVGGGIVPGNPLARRFRDLVGLANQMMAKEADEVIFMQSGIPTRIKSKVKS